MAKISIINRNIKRLKLVHKYAEKRSNLNNIMNDLTLTEDERHIARIKLQKLPRDSSPVRLRNRCSLTGRPRGVYSKFGLGRSKLRDIAMSGKIPGIIKASW
ncbi:MAG TPA: 30S ribosomal protein S14 [Nitrosomonas sp.]|jgi:small subunit ribosomal protein S14|nr:30S ribosomal protein S14 [Nitrosomonas sp.]MDO8333250.1 30S ribosomal protein S14 [Nitrosomonas sp.]HRB96417.1 30S ribosomal protein S14 [Nitrosomonas sp.]